MRRDVWHLHPVDVIVSTDHMVEAVLPVHRNKWHSIITVKQESAISIYGLLHFRCISVLNDRLKHLCHILCNRQRSCSCIRLCGFYDRYTAYSMFSATDGRYSQFCSANQCPSASSHKILIFSFPYERVCTPLHSICSTPHRHAQTLRTFSSDFL